MVSGQEEQHIIRPVRENQFLPSLQKTILLYLAENCPKSKYAINKGINGHYKSVWDSISALNEKGVVVEISKGEYRGRNYPVYWLTTAGVFIALVEGANQKNLLNKALQIYAENKLVQCIIELSTVIGTDTYKIAYSAVLNSKKLEKNDLYQMVGTLLAKDLSLDQLKELILIMNKYPEQFGNLKEQVKKMQENLKKVEQFIDGIKEE